MERAAARKPWVAALLSVPLPGLGHLYDGSPGSAALAFGVFAVISGAGPAATWATFAGMAATYTLGAAWVVATAVHAAVSARRTGEVRLGWYQRWPVYVLLLLSVHLGLRAAFYRFGLPYCRFHAYRVTTTAMADTLRVGELVIADASAYRVRAPSRGDLVVFRYPVQPSTEFIKRCVAIAGDTIAIEDKRVTLNGRPLDEPYAIHTDPNVLPSFLAPGSEFAKRDTLAPYRVPDRAFFALGDNRDNSYDSRFWGPVDLGAVRGKVLYICLSKDLTRVGRQVR